MLDEPTAGLSQTDTRTVMRLLRPVMAGRTTIVITHDTSVAALADRIVTTEGGADYLAAPASPAGAQLTGVTFPV